MGSKRGTRGGYLSFLLRLWRVSVAGKPAWRVSLQRPGEAEKQAFEDLDEMVAFLRAEAAESDGAKAAETEVSM